MNKSQHLNQWARPDSYMGFNPVGDYLIAGQSRDSDCLEQSNYRTIFKAITDKAESLGCQDNGIDGEGDESPMVYDFRANHWAVGWVEEILICQNAPQELIDFADEIAAALADYPVFDEMDFSELEHETAANYWESMSVSDRIDAIERSGSDSSIFAARRDYLPCNDNGSLENYLVTP